jgi:hypothetical protein
MADRGERQRAVIFNPAHGGEKPIRLDLSKAKHFACCEGAYLVRGSYELTGSDPKHTYSVIPRIYFGSGLTGSLRDEVQLALKQLQLPSPR